jgi:hypothetical protein
MSTRFVVEKPKIWAKQKRKIWCQITQNLRPKKYIDYRWADGRILMLPRGMTVSNTRYLSSSETRVNAVIRGWKLHLSEITLCQESVGGI